MGSDDILKVAMDAAAIDCEISMSVRRWFSFPDQYRKVETADPDQFRQRSLCLSFGGRGYPFAGFLRGSKGLYGE